MLGSMILYLIWHHKSPLNQELASRNPLQTEPTGQPIDININLPETNPITGEPWGTPNPTDPCNPIYVQLFGSADCTEHLRQIHPVVR